MRKASKTSAVQLIRRPRPSKRRTKMLTEYDFTGGVRGKYAARYRKGTNVVVLAPDVAQVFPDAESVNRVLRACAEILRERPRRTTHRR